MMTFQLPHSLHIYDASVWSLSTLMTTSFLHHQNSQL